MHITIQKEHQTTSPSVSGKSDWCGLLLPETIAKFQVPKPRWASERPTIASHETGCLWLSLKTYLILSKPSQKLCLPKEHFFFSFSFSFLTIKDISLSRHKYFSKKQSSHLWSLSIRRKRERKKKSLPLKDSDFLSIKYTNQLEIYFTDDYISTFTLSLIPLCFKLPLFQTVLFPRRRLPSNFPFSLPCFPLPSSHLFST